MTKFIKKTRKNLNECSLKNLKDLKKSKGFNLSIICLGNHLNQLKIR